MNQPYRVIIVDDEPPARDILDVFVGRVPDLQRVALCANALQALDAIRELEPDLVFLDVQMPQMTGMDLIRLPLLHRPDIVLTTAYPEYALKSYEFAVLDYLMKPIAFERFMQTIVRFKEKKNQTTPSTGWATIDQPSSGPAPDKENDQASPGSIWLREEKKLLQIPYEDVLYVEGFKDYVKVFLKNEMILTHMNIGKAEGLFCPPEFIRIHRSHIVRRSAIRLIDGSTMQLTNGTELIIGPHYREELKKFISALR